MKYFVRIDYIYKCSPVQRVRALVDSSKSVCSLIRQHSSEGYMLLSVRVEMCQ